MEHEKKIEKEIQEKGLNAPRLSPAGIDAVIVDKTFTNLPSGKCVVCEITLKNGFTVRGESACVSPENFDQHIGNEIAFKNARDKVWQLEGYLLQEKNPVKRDADTLPDWKMRVIVERDQLLVKYLKLEEFMVTNAFSELSDSDRDKLALQRKVMSQYIDVLEQRISDS